MRLAPWLGPGGLRADLTGLRRGLWLCLAIEASILMYVSGKSRRGRAARWRINAPGGYTHFNGSCTSASRGVYSPLF